MSIQLELEEMPGYLAARFVGEGKTEGVWQQFELIAENCKRMNNNKLLMDFTGAKGNVSLVDRYYLGERLQIFALYRLKVASVGRPKQTDPQKFGELVARNLKVNVRAFTDFQAAVKWLLE